MPCNKDAMKFLQFRPRRFTTIEAESLVLFQPREKEREIKGEVETKNSPKVWSSGSTPTYITRSHQTFANKLKTNSNAKKKKKG